MDLFDRSSETYSQRSVRQSRERAKDSVPPSLYGAEASAATTITLAVGVASPPSFVLPSVSFGPSEIAVLA